MSLLDPTFQLPSVKVEEEVPRILRDLGYLFLFMASHTLYVVSQLLFPVCLASLYLVVSNDLGKNLFPLKYILLTESN